MRNFKPLAVVTIILAMFVAQAMAQPLIYVSSGERVKNKYPFAGGVSCCGCTVTHSGTLPEDFPKSKITAVTFYLLNSREDSYYTRVKAGPTTLKFVLNGGSSVASSIKLPVSAVDPVKHSWYIRFPFNPPVEAGPGVQWKLLDGDNNKYSAVMVHSSDSGDPAGLPGIDHQTGCQYKHKINSRYSVKFEFDKMPPISPRKRMDGKPHITEKKRETVLKTAVVEFEERGDLEIPDAGAIVADWMTTALQKTGAFEVYERLSLDKLLEEHEMGMSGLMDEETIARIGKMRGVQAIVTGSVIKFGDIVSVTAKLIDTETAQIIDTAAIKTADINSLSYEIDNLAIELATE